MNNIKSDVMKIKCIILFLFGVSLCACFDDKGNYDCNDMADITIEECPGGDRGVGKFRSYRYNS